MITGAELQLANTLTAEGASFAEALTVVGLAREYDQVAARFGIPVSRTIELVGMRIHSESHASAWRHELRGPHGEWISSGATLSKSVSVETERSAAEQEGQFRRIAREEALKAAAIQAGKVRGVVEQEQGRQLREQAMQIRQLERQVRSANQRVSAIAEQTEGRKARTKSLAVIGSLIGGAVLGGIEAKLGVPDIAALASSIAPATIESLFEWRKRL